MREGHVHYEQICTPRRPLSCNTHDYANLQCHCSILQIMHYLKHKELLEKQKLKGQQPLEIRMESKTVNEL